MHLWCSDLFSFASKNWRKFKFLLYGRELAAGSYTRIEVQTQNSTTNLPTGWRLSTSWGPNIGAPWNRHEHFSTMVLRCLMTILYRAPLYRERGQFCFVIFPRLDRGDLRVKWREAFWGSGEVSWLHFRNYAFPIDLCTKRNSVWCHINRKSVITTFVYVVALSRVGGFRYSNLDLFFHGLEIIKPLESYSTR